MKMKNRTLIYPITIIGILLMLSSSCKKDDENPTNQTNGKTTAVFNPNLTYGSLTDQEGNIYKTITIGSQTWMAENLRTTKYRDGETISLIKDNTAWRELATSAYCNYKNTKSIDTIATFGRLYNYYAAIDNRNIAPEGWHIPTNAEWTKLITYLGGGDVVAGDTTAGAFLKEAGDIHWLLNTVFGNPIADNSSGFTAVASGWRACDGFGRVVQTNFWSVTESTATEAWFRSLIIGSSGVLNLDYGYKNLGFSVRCVKD